MLVLLETVVVETKQASCGRPGANSTMNKKGILNQGLLFCCREESKLLMQEVFGRDGERFSC
jgi:hypothetical protein